MIVDDLDICILRKFSDLKKNETQDIWDWTLEFFPKEKSDRQRTKNYQKIVRHIKKMGELFDINENGKQKYVLDGDKVIFSKRKLPNGIRDCLLVLVDGLWNILELPSVD